MMFDRCRRAISAASFTLALLGATPLSAQVPLMPDSLNGWKARDIGPSVAGGRVAAVVGIPGDPSTYYIGAAGGGVWKTTNGGNSWKDVFKDEPTSSIGAIALAPSNPNLVWVGTGEGSPRNDVTNGHGVFFSPDAGASWKFMGLADVGQVPRIAVDPADPDHVFVAALGKVWTPNPERGIYRTTDGGKTWQKVLFVNDSTGGGDVAIMPGNPRIVFAALWQMQRLPWTLEDGGMGSGIYRSTDGGATWTKLTEGLPDGPLGRIALGIAPSDPQHIYALIESTHGVLWESRDGGDHWHMVSDNHALDVRPFYFSQVNVDPKDENHVFFASFQLMESTDGGHTAHSIDHDVHPDHHALWIDPVDPKRMIQGNDGGVYVTADGGETWRFLNNLPIEQFYMVAADTRMPYHLCGGLQDNSAWCGPGAGIGFGGVPQSEWVPVVGGDGEYAVPAPSDSTIIYTDSQNGSIIRLDLTTGDSRYIQPYLPGVSQMPPSELKYRFNWTSPIAVSPTSANTVYLGGDVVFRSTDGGQSWRVISPDLTQNEKSRQITSGGPIFKDISGAETYNTILSITLAPSSPDSVIWVGTDDGNIQYTRDGGRTWTNVRPNLKGVPPEGRIYQVGVSPFDPGEVYIAVDRHMFADNHPYVFKSTDWGKTWKSISAGLPDDQAAHVVREDPNQRDLLVLGTDNDIYYSRDGGANWKSLHGAFPTAPYWDVQFEARQHDLLAATHGRGLFVLDDITPLEQMREPAGDTGFVAFKPRAAIAWSASAPQSQEPSRYSAPNPPYGAIIDYYLPAKLDTTKAEAGPGGHHGPVRIAILDSQGDTVTTEWGPGDKGLNRHTWNLRYKGPTRLDFGNEGGGGFGGFSNGPQVLPGTYTVAVTVNGKTQTQSVEVRPDPNVSYNAAAARQILATGQDMVKQVSALNTVLNRVHSLRQQLQHTQGLYSDNDGMKMDSAVASQARELGKTLGTFMDSLYNPKVQRNAPEDDIHYLSDFQGELQNLGFALFYGSSSVPLPGAVTDQIAQTKQELQQHVARFNSLVQTDVAAYNKLASQHGVPVLISGGTVSLQ
jgi:photosystem II stability/assembly factor-like uncharacterized protein